MIGRPTKLTEELFAAAREYLDREGSYGDPRLPSIEGLALHLGVHRDTLHTWDKEDGRFSDILEELRQRQAKKLIDKGLNNLYNSTISKLILSKHGYVEKQETDLTTKGKELPSPILGGMSVSKHDSDTEDTQPQ